MTIPINYESSEYKIPVKGVATSTWKAEINYEYFLAEMCRHNIKFLDGLLLVLCGAVIGALVILLIYKIK